MNDFVFNSFLGKRPKVRGVAMNACDHPHGGGEGKTGCKISEMQNRMREASMKTNTYDTVRCSMRSLSLPFQVNLPKRIEIFILITVFNKELHRYSTINSL